MLTDDFIKQFSKRIECAFHRAKLRNLTPSIKHGWTIDWYGNKYILDNEKYVFIPALFLEGRPINKNDKFHFLNATAKILNISSELLQLFNDGFCIGFEDYIYKCRNDIDMLIMLKLGDYFRLNQNKYYV